MKLTKSQLKQLIKEEISDLDEIFGLGGPKKLGHEKISSPEEIAAQKNKNAEVSKKLTDILDNPALGGDLANPQGLIAAQIRGLTNLIADTPVYVEDEQRAEEIKKGMNEILEIVRGLRGQERREPWDDSEGATEAPERELGLP